MTLELFKHELNFFHQWEAPAETSLNPTRTFLWDYRTPWTLERRAELKVTAVCLLLSPTLLTRSLPQFPSLVHVCPSPKSCPQHIRALQRHSALVLIPETSICQEQKAHFGMEDLGLSLSLLFKWL